MPGKRYMRAYAGLYGEVATTLPIPSVERSHGTSIKCRSEFEEQCQAATWLKRNDILFFHVPNGGLRSKAAGAMMKAAGVIPGVPDFVIPIPSPDGAFHGLFIEIKRKDGGSGLSSAQKFWFGELRKRGYACYEAKGALDLIIYVKKYLQKL